ncbi:legumain-like [Macrobrachium nipponense]|uniref:legumain-like n=1 Tax=Macrobrachium nipponense TaxID=159736 RepID=UPI0030C7BC3D
MNWFLWCVAIAVTCSSEGARLRSLDNILENDSDSGELWAVLVAGSNGWYNYRHQADVCHAYQILHKHGVPDDHIIVMMYDDISNNSLNPNPGVIINRPNGPNVYKGVPKDYTGKDVTPRNFLHILNGNAKAMEGIGSGKVINSTDKDRIFINLVDHGGPGVFCFPEHVLHANVLARVIRDLHKKRKFKEMVVYVEACESGSLFEGLLPNSKVYALTAANPHEPSYACYLDKELGTYLGDVFSIKWMEDTDKEDIHKETLKEQFHILQKEVTTSHVKQWGERKISNEKLWKFLGERDDRSKNSIRSPNTENQLSYDTTKSNYASLEYESKQHYLKGKVKHHGKLEKNNTDVGDLHAINVNLTQDDMPDEDECLASAVTSPDVPVKILESRILTSKNDMDKDERRRELETLHMTRLLVQVVMHTLVKEITEDDEKKPAMFVKDRSRKITQWKCHEFSVDIFDKMCFNIGQNPYVVRLLHVIVNLCEHGYTSDQFEEAAQKVCTFQKFTGII